MQKINGMKKYFYLFLFPALSLQAQLYTDYLGSGHSQGLTVTASSSKNGVAGLNATVNGQGLDDSLFEAARFLSQASLGAKLDYIRQVKNMGLSAWTEDQFMKPASFLRPRVDTIWNILHNIYITNGIPEEDIYGPAAVHFNYTYWDTNLKNSDLLRQRIAEALSEILVISYNSDLEGSAVALSSYYDILLKNAFGNYKDLLMEVSRHPAMGYYLSHFQNRKTNVQANTRPDENYAREIMQLFTIGLIELNNDGSPKLDSVGKEIPTYDNEDIRQMAKIFTGFGAPGVEPWVDWTVNDTFYIDFYASVKDVPMKMYDNWHEPGEKILLKQMTVPSGQTGLQDVDQAITFLFNHPNMGPFLAKKLIQRLVKSNPSPEYIGRVATAFNGGGSTPRGDMKAVIRAILFDPEARTRAGMERLDAGILRPPFLRIMHLMRSLNLVQPNNLFLHNGYSVTEATGQHVMASPTVFNFYPPDYTPIGDLSDNGLVGPEFKLHNSSKSIRYLNTIYSTVFWDIAFWSWDGDYIDNPTIDFTDLLDKSTDIEKMIHEADIVYTNGQMSEQTKSIIRQALKDMYWNWNNNFEWKRYRAGLLLYLTLISPDYNILK